MIYNILSNKTGQTFKHVLPGYFSAVTASAYSPSGAAVSVSVTSQSLAVGLTVDAFAGDTEFTVNSLSGLRLDNQYVLKNSTYENLFAVKKIDPSTKVVESFRPLQQDFASGSTIMSPTIQFTFPDSLEYLLGYRLELEYLDFFGERKFETLAFNAVPYSLKSDLTLEILAGLDGLVEQKITSETNFTAMKEATWDSIVARVHTNKQLGTLVGTINLTTPHAYLVLVQLAQGAGPDYLEYRNMLARRFEEELTLVLTSIQTFGNSTGQTKQKDWFRTVQVIRTS